MSLLKKSMETLFLEYEEVYKGTFYGTLKNEIKRIWGIRKTCAFRY